MRAASSALTSRSTSLSRRLAASTSPARMRVAEKLSLSSTTRFECREKRLAQVTMVLLAASSASVWSALRSRTEWRRSRKSSRKVLRLIPRGFDPSYAFTCPEAAFSTPFVTFRVGESGPPGLKLRAMATQEGIPEEAIHPLEQRLQELRDKEAEAEHAGDESAVARQHDRGKLTARERIDKLLDPGTFVETDKLVRHRGHGFGIEDRRPFSDAVITGWGTIDGRKVFAFAQDFTVFGGSLGEVMGDPPSYLGHRGAGRGGGGFLPRHDRPHLHGVRDLAHVHHRS